MEAQPDAKAWFQALRTLFFALLAGMIIMAAVLFFAVAPPPPNGMLYPLIVLALLVNAAVTGRIIFKNRVNAARDLSGLADKLEAYRAATILRLALGEGAVLVALVLYFFAAGDPLLLPLAGVGMVNFATLVPQRSQVVRDLDLSSTEQMLLD